jgi:hypothetical protein
MKKILTKKENLRCAFHFSIQGASHIKAHKICQDSSYSQFTNFDKYGIAIVCDGHGGNNYFRSDRGSKIAVEVTKKAMNGFMKNFVDIRTSLFAHYDPFIRQLETNIIYKWRSGIKVDFDNEPFSDKELEMVDDDYKVKYRRESDKYFAKAYGTTLIVILYYPNNFWMGLQIGDGKCVGYYEDGTFDQPIPWDDDCFLNTTTSLCEENAINKFRHCFLTERFPKAIFVGSDGIDDSFANDNDLYGFYSEIIRTFKEKGKDQALKEIKEFLPILSQKGSGDDVSVSGIIFV